MSGQNIERAAFEEVGERPGFRCRRTRIGRELGCERVGLSLFELPPGEAAYPYHWHTTEEELVVVVEGRPTLRTPEGLRELEQGEVVRFPLGEEGAHQVLNRSGEPVRFLAFANQQADIVVYPDSGKLLAGDRGLRGTGLRKIFRLEDAVGYWDGEEAPGP